VIIKQGLGEATAKITDVSLLYDAQKSMTTIKLLMSKEGPYSINGDFNVYWAAKSGGEEVIVARLHDHTFYHELPSLQQSLTWNDSTPRTGVLRVVYEGRGKNRGKIWSESILNITPSLFTPLSTDI